MPHLSSRRVHAHLGLVSLAASALGLVPATAAHGATGTPVVPGSSYALASGATGQCLGGLWAATADRTPVVQQPCQGLLDQSWQLTPDGTGGYTIANRAAHTCLNVLGGSTTPGTPIIEYACNGGANERFTLTTAPDGATLLHPQNNALCLDLPGGSPAPGLRLQQYPCHGGANQRWLLTRTDPLTFSDPGFEPGAGGWTFTAHTGTATNNPHSGSGLAYLDAGTGYRISQSITAPRNGSYDVSAWISAGAAGGTLTVQVNGGTAGSLTLPAQTTYALYTVPRVQVHAGDTVTLAIGSAPGGWINADDVTVTPSAPNDPQISSANPTVTALFDWAKTKANSFATQPGVTGPINGDATRQGVYSNTIWAGYPFRPYYYSRDFAHQLVGAHLLGLDAANKTMLRSFAASATPGQGYDPYWSVNFDARTPGAIDYNGPTSFVRELPAAFELAQKVNDAYTWTGDPDYLHDPALSTFVANTVGPYVSGHTGPIDNGGTPVAQATSGDIFQGVASYNENGATLAESGDAIGSQYQAYLAAAALAGANGDTSRASAYTDAAAKLKRYYNSTWSVDPADPAKVVRAYDVNGTAYTDWGKENSWFMPLKDIMDPGPRRDAYLDFIDAQASGPGAPGNLEADTYLPDVFFAHDRGATGWKWMQYVYANVNASHGGFLNADYPEISYTLLSQTVQGLLGVQPDSGADALTTTSRLPEDIGWLQLTSIPVGGHTVTLRHDGTTGSTLTNTSTGGSLSWTARFPGIHAGITVDGTARPVRTVTVDGTTYTCATVTVAAGQTAVVRVTG